MNIQIKAKKVKLTAELESYIQKKMDMLEKYLGKIPVKNCDVEIGLAVSDQHSGDIFRCEVNLQVPGELLRVEKNEPDMNKAVDKVKDHLQRAIKRYKEKKMDKKRQGAKE